MATIQDKIDAAVEAGIANAKSVLEADVETKLKALSKDFIAERESAPKEDKELTTKFYQALASKDSTQMKAVQEEIRADYQAKGQTVGTDAEGGYLVPTTVSTSIIDKLSYVSPMRRIANVISNMPAELQLTSGSLPTTYWVAEGVAITESDVDFTPKTLTPHKAAGLDTMTSEFLQDAALNPSVQNYIEDRFVLSLALLENEAFVNGDGSGKPYGFRSADVTPTSVAQVGTTVGSLAYSDLVALKWALGAAYEARGTFALSPEAFAKVESMVDGNDRPIYRESIAAGVPATLLGRPVVVLDEIPANLGAGTNATEIWYGDFKAGYTIGDRGGLRVDYGTSGDDFAKDQVKLRVIKRVAGRPIGNYNFAKLTGVL